MRFVAQGFENMQNTIGRITTALLLGVAIALAGWSVSQGLERFRMADRSVTVSAAQLASSQNFK